MPSIEERLAELESHRGITDGVLKQLQQQQALTVEVARNILQGKFDDGRITLDALDPARAGTWRNVDFPRARRAPRQADVRPARARRPRAGAPRP